MARTRMTGLDLLRRKLFRLPIEAKKEIMFAMEKGANEIVNFAKTLAPVGTQGGVKGSNNPGALRDSIGWTWGNAPRGTITLGQVKTNPNGPDDLKITIFAGNSEAFYARWVEFGTQAHYIEVVNASTLSRGGVDFGTSVNHPGAKATPFFYPAYRAMRKRVRSRISGAVRRSIRNVAKSR